MAWPKARARRGRGYVRTTPRGVILIVGAPFMHTMWPHTRHPLGRLPLVGEGGSRLGLGAVAATGVVWQWRGGYELVASTGAVRVPVTT